MVSAKMAHDCKVNTKPFRHRHWKQVFQVELFTSVQTLLHVLLPSFLFIPFHHSLSSSEEISRQEDERVIATRVPCNLMVVRSEHLYDDRSFNVEARLFIVWTLVCGRGSLLHITYRVWVIRVEEERAGFVRNLLVASPCFLSSRDTSRGFPFVVRFHSRMDTLWQ